MARCSLWRMLQTPTHSNVLQKYEHALRSWKIWTARPREWDSTVSGRRSTDLTRYLLQMCACHRSARSASSLTLSTTNLKRSCTARRTAPQQHTSGGTTFGRRITDGTNTTTLALAHATGLGRQHSKHLTSNTMTRHRLHRTWCCVVPSSQFLSGQGRSVHHRAAVLRAGQRILCLCS
jgi:hypothetical protein